MNSKARRRIGNPGGMANDGPVWGNDTQKHGINNIDYLSSCSAAQLFNATFLITTLRPIAQNMIESKCRVTCGSVEGWTGVR